MALPETQIISFEERCVMLLRLFDQYVSIDPKKYDPIDRLHVLSKIEMWLRTRAMTANCFPITVYDICNNNEISGYYPNKWSMTHDNSAGQWSTGLWKFWIENDELRTVFKLTWS